MLFEDFTNPIEAPATKVHGLISEIHKNPTGVVKCLFYQQIEYDVA